MCLKARLVKQESMKQESYFETFVATFCKQSPFRATVFDWCCESGDRLNSQDRPELMLLSLLLQLKTMKLWGTWSRTVQESPLTRSRILLALDLLQQIPSFTNILVCRSDWYIHQGLSEVSKALSQCHPKTDLHHLMLQHDNASARTAAAKNKLQSVS